MFIVLYLPCEQRLHGLLHFCHSGVGCFLLLLLGRLIGQDKPVGLGADLGDLHQLHVLVDLGAVGPLDGHAGEFAGEGVLGDSGGADEVVPVEVEAVEGCAISQCNLPCPFFHFGLLPNSS